MFCSTRTKRLGTRKEKFNVDYKNLFLLSCPAIQCSSQYSKIFKKVQKILKSLSKISKKCAI